LRFARWLCVLWLFSALLLPLVIDNIRRRRRVTGFSLGRLFCLGIPSFHVRVRRCYALAFDLSGLHERFVYLIALLIDDARACLIPRFEAYFSFECFDLVVV
jgi:hypothetical protein